MTADEKLAEIRWLTEGGCTPEEVATAMGVKIASIARLAYRHDQRDLALRFQEAIGPARKGGIRTRQLVLQ